MIKKLILTQYLVLFSLVTVMTGYAQDSESQTVQEIPKLKQTNLGLYVTAKEAYEKWKGDPEKVKILDVRTPEEYIFVGHAEMAWNIPLEFQAYQWNAAKGYFALKTNPAFIALVKDQFTPEDTLLITCRSGGRSAMAVNLLAENGFKHVYNIIDGYGRRHG